MNLQEYVNLVKRYLVLLLAVPVAVSAVAFVRANGQAERFASTAIVLLRPNDPNERLGTTADSGTEVFNADRFVRAQANVVRGPEVRADAAAFIGDVNEKDIQRALSVSAAVDSNILRISATTTSADRSQAIANGVANAFIENRRKAAVEGLERALENIKVKIDEAGDELDRLSKLPDSPFREAQMSTAMSQVQSLSDRQVQLEIDVDLKRGEAQLISPATTSETPVSPRPLRSAFLALIAGLVVTFGALLLREQLDMRLRSREEAEQVSGLSTLAEVPDDRQTGRDPLHIAAAADPDGVVAETIRSLRVSLRFVGLDEPLKVVVVTSATPGDGKSTLATNLAVSYSQSGMRTLLVSGDLRRPRVERLTAATGGVGLVELLSEMASAEEAQRVEARRRAEVESKYRSKTEDGDPVVAAPTRSRRAAAVRTVERAPVEITTWCQNEVENLFVLPAGHAIANPLEILGSGVTREFFELARRDFDMVIVDSPPVMPVSDPVVLSQFADGVIVVASLRKTSRELLRRSIDTLQAGQARVLGIVINRATRDTGGYYGSYGYRRANKPY